MTIRFTLAAACALAATAALALPAAAQQKASAALKDADGNSVGTVQLMETPNGVLLSAKLSGLPAGKHAFHIHETGKCEPPFTSAGGHYNPTGAKHGFEVKGGPHAGDMPNITIPESGSLAFDTVDPRVTLAKGKKTTLFDDDGSAIVIHAGADDYKSQPSGDAGDRIACGVIKQGSEQAAATQSK